MEIVTNNQIDEMVVGSSQVINKRSPFIEANTKPVTIDHLKDECIIPVFAKDNEMTISHGSFIDRILQVVKQLYPNSQLLQPEIRVSHTIKGRTPEAIGIPVKDLKEHQKTIYYERCAFAIEIPSIKQKVNGNELSLTIGGVRAINQENLYSRKTLEKFKVFIGFKNMVCCNLCVNTDGFLENLRVSNLDELEEKVSIMIQEYNMDKHLGMMEKMSKYSFTEKQFAHFIGKARMYQFLEKSSKANIFQIDLNDSQINQVVKSYYLDENFKRNSDGSINLWSLYNLFTGANKSSYIDSNLERNVNAYELINNLGNSIENKLPNWYLHN